VWYSLWYGRWYGLVVDVEERLARMVELLASSRDETVGTSVRIPIDLRDAAAIAAELGLADSITELTVRGLRDKLDAIANRAILEEHFKQYPEARPTLAQVALAGAYIDGNPLKDRPELIERAAEKIAAVRADPSPDDVLLYAAGLADGLGEAA
jgi:hypothetical protein